MKIPPDYFKDMPPGFAEDLSQILLYIHGWLNIGNTSVPLEMVDNMLIQLYPIFETIEEKGE